MMDGRFDHYFFQIFAESRDREAGPETPASLPLALYGLGVAMVTAIFTLALA